MLRARYELELDLSSVPDLVQRFAVSSPGGPPQSTQRFDRPASTPLCRVYVDFEAIHARARSGLLGENQTLGGAFATGFWSVH
jgi:hypothetical protein